MGAGASVAVPQAAAALARSETVRAATLFRDSETGSGGLPRWPYLALIGALSAALIGAAVWFSGSATLTLYTSLALALALSDLVSHKVSIDSLFLDEGFGTLDKETLDIALDALDNLHASGKTIGVISHIDAMKERIPVQIKVRKKSGVGISELDRTYKFDTIASETS